MFFFLAYWISGKISKLLSGCSKGIFEFSFISERSGYFQSGKPPNIPAEVLEEAEVITVEPNDDEFFDEMEASEQLREADTLSEGDTLP